MTTLLRLSLVGTFGVLGVSCATQPRVASTQPTTKRICKVRTTAYTHTERGGSRNAIGSRLSGKDVRSAAADWSRWPLGTKFRIVDTDEVFQIDDYGSALIGTGTIDLYRSNRLEMRRWGVRSVDIDIIEWGSKEKSLEILSSRKKNRCVQRMIVSLSQQSERPDFRQF